MKFKLKSSFQPTGDQPEAIEKLAQGVRKGYGHQVLLGVTGSGKTFTMANLIEKIQKPTLVISHNKTLAAQLYQEFRDFFPENAASYFVSYYDYYQPEAYLPRTDTYIEKETDINQEIDKLRLQATANLLTRKDVIVVASVSCLYSLGPPEEYRRFALVLKAGAKWERKKLFRRLVDLRYKRSEYDFFRGTFRVRGETVDIFPAYEDEALRIEWETDEKIKSLKMIEPFSGKILSSDLDSLVLYPAKHYMTDPAREKEAMEKISLDLKKEAGFLKNQGKELEAHRLKTKVNYDLEQIREFGYVNGIENYSRYFDGRRPGEPPYTLLDYFAYVTRDRDFLIIIDESHMTIPQIRGMYEGDAARKKTLIDYGFRLKAAKDNRPLKFGEFLSRSGPTIYTSATPAVWELKKARQVVEQLVRPTGIVDPRIEVRPVKGQIEGLIGEIEKRVKCSQRVLVTTLTKKMAEALASFMGEREIKVHYLHSEIKTLDRGDILDDLRLGKYDVLVGINLLREGLDLPEVSLVAILDADKEGFLRSETSLIQTMGRAARHTEGTVLMYADKITGSMRRAITEINRRRKVQEIYNQKHGISPRSVKKPIREKLIQREKEEKGKIYRRRKIFASLSEIDPNQLMPLEKKKLTRTLRRQMRQAAADLEFELAAEIRDKITELERLRA